MHTHETHASGGDLSEHILSQGLALTIGFADGKIPAAASLLDDPTGDRGTTGSACRTSSSAEGEEKRLPSVPTNEPTSISSSLVCILPALGEAKAGPDLTASSIRVLLCEKVLWPPVEVVSKEEGGGA